MNYKFYISLVVSMLLMMPNVLACNNENHHCTTNSTNIHSCAHSDSGCSACMLKGSGKTNKKFTPPQKSIVALRSNSVSSVENSVFDCTYYNMTDEAALNAFQYALAIWEANITSLVPIHLEVNWSRELPEGALAGCSTTGYAINFYGQEKRNTLYPSALYTKLSHDDFSTDLGSTANMAISINASLENWYFGTDGNTPEGEYDFVTVMLHELAHGLGLSGTGQYGFGYSHNEQFRLSIFDTFMKDSAGNFLGDQKIYPSFSEEQIQSFMSPMFFHGELAMEANDNKPVSIYAPQFYAEGSSLYHLDTSFHKDDNNALLCYSLDMGRAIHTPGPVLLGLLRDLGWDVLDIAHETVDYDSPSTASHTFDFKAQSEYGLDVNNISFHYRKTGASAYSVAMVQDNGNGKYSSTVDDLEYNNEYQYYFKVKDYKKGVERSSTFPVNYSKPSTFYFGTDTIAPVILAMTEEPAVWINIDTSISIYSYVTDNSSIKEMSIEWFINDVAQVSVTMDASDKTNVYNGYISLPNDLTDDAVLKYRVKATDASSISNVTTMPEEGYSYATLTNFSPLTENLIIDFEDPNCLDHCLLDGMMINTPDQFTGLSLNTEHPYPKSEILKFTLRHDFTIQDNTKISFDEIVLVEEAYEGISYPSNMFYDYAIVEGSNDGGVTWEAIEPGYDAGLYKEWAEFWYTDMEDIDGKAPGSLAYGIPSQYRHHVITFTDSPFKVGETILIRFKLDSDYVITGWGWNIDNLVIDLDGTTAINEKKATSTEVSISPNPAHDYITLSTDMTSSVTFYSLSGQALKQTVVESGREIYVGDLPQGIVLVKIENNTGVYTSKLIRE